MSISVLSTWKRRVPPPRCASTSYFSKSPCQILVRYQILLHFAEAGPATEEGNDRQKRMYLMINPRLTSVKSVSTVYDMFAINYSVVLQMETSHNQSLSSILFT